MTERRRASVSLRVESSSASLVSGCWLRTYAQMKGKTPKTPITPEIKLQTSSPEMVVMVVQTDFKLELGGSDSRLEKMVVVVEEENGSGKIDAGPYGMTLLLSIARGGGTEVTTRSQRGWIWQWRLELRKQPPA